MKPIPANPYSLLQLMEVIKAMKTSTKYLLLIISLLMILLGLWISFGMTGLGIGIAVIGLGIFMLLPLFKD